MAVRGNPGDRAHAFLVGLDFEVQVVRDVEIEKPVAVELEEGGAGRPARRRRAPRERKVPSPLLRYRWSIPNAVTKHVDVAVIVQIGRGASHSVALARDPGVLGHVAEGTVPEISVETVRLPRSARSWKRRPVDEEEVGKLVAVVVESENPSAGDLHDVAPSAAAEVVAERDARLAAVTSVSAMTTKKITALLARVRLLASGSSAPRARSSATRAQELRAPSASPSLSATRARLYQACKCSGSASIAAWKERAALSSSARRSAMRPSWK